MKENIRKIEREVRKMFDSADQKFCGFKWFYKHHLCVVKRLSLKLADSHKADKNVVWLASILHDIGYLNHHDDHAKGVVDAKKLMKKHGINGDTIKRVEYCILMHHEHKKPKTKEARIIRIADALAHFDKGFIKSMSRIKKRKFNKWFVMKINHILENLYYL